MAKSSLALIVVLLLAALAVWADTTPPNIDKALQAQYELVVERPDDAMAHNDLGNLLSLTGRLDEAESAYRRAKDLDAADPSIRFNLGLLFQQAGRLDDANQEFYSLLELDPKNAWAYYQLGVVAVDQGKNRKATELYARSFAIDPTLSFPEHNPHIIDNDLATEALLMSSRFKSDSTARVPRKYAEAARIADLMLEEEALAAEEMLEEEAEAEAEEGTEWDEPVDPSAELLEDGEGESARVLTNEDLEDLSPVGQAGGRNSRRGARSKGTSRYSSGRSAGRDGSEEQDRRSRYRPRSSSGRNNSLGGSGYTTMGRAGEEEGGTDEAVEKSGTSTLRPTVGQPRAGAPISRPIAGRPQAGRPTPDRPTSTRPITARPGSGGGGRPFESGTGSTASLRFELVGDQDDTST